MNNQKLEVAVEKYGWEGVVDRCTYKGDHCTMYFRIRERGFAEHIVTKIHADLMVNYSETGVRRLFMKCFMGGFSLSSDQNV